MTVPEPVSAMLSSKVATRLASIATLVAPSAGFLLVMAGSVSGAGTAEMLAMSVFGASKASPLITVLLVRATPPASFRSVMANATPKIVSPLRTGPVTVTPVLPQLTPEEAIVTYCPTESSVKMGATLRVSLPFASKMKKSAALPLLSDQFAPPNKLVFQALSAAFAPREKIRFKSKLS